jgi:hypothetical protein
MRQVAIALLIPLLLSACFGGTDPNLTTSGEGKPVLSIEFPPSVEPRAEEVAKLEITNPGPGDMDVITVSFTPLGAPDLPGALIGFGAKNGNPSIADIDPKPRNVSLDGVLYTFEGVPEGGSKTIEFTIRTPVLPGRYANSVRVTDGSDPSRERGVPLETRVEG